MMPILGIGFLFYVVALHSSIAGMEIFSWLLAVAGAVLACKDFSQLRRFISNNRLILLLLLALPLWVLISCLSSPLEKPLLLQVGFMRWTVLVVGLTLFMRQFWSAELDRRLVYVWTACLAITSAYAVLQMFTGIDFIRVDVVQPQTHGLFKAVGFFSMSLTFAYVLGQAYFGVCQRVYRQFGGKIFVLISLLWTFGLISSMARGAWIGALFCGALYLFIKAKKWLVPFLLAGGLVLAVAVQYKPGFQGATMDHSSSMRVDLWRAYGQMFLDHPIVGVGIFEGDKLLPQYYSRLGIDQTFASHAHNNYMQWLAGSGLPGLLLYLGIIFFFMRMAWRLRDKNPWGWGLLLAQVFLHVGGFTEASFFDGEVNHFIVFIFALTWAQSSKPQSKT